MSNPKKRKPKNGKSRKVTLPDSLKQIKLNAAGIDVHSEEHWVCVPQDRDSQPVRRFEAFTADLYRLADWLRECGIETVAMESTGVYWIPLFQVLEARGFEVNLVNARDVKNVSGRKTDMLDCQWLQQLHTYGLLKASFRPEQDICVLRSYLRHRNNLIEDCTTHVQHMQKALTEMNILLHKVISDITGVTGMRIIRAILEGERDRAKLANMKDYRIKSSSNQIAKSLEGDYRQEHLFVLGQSLELYEFYHKKIDECDEKIIAHMQKFQPKVDIKEKPLKERKGSHKKPQRNEPKEDWRPYLYQMSGVDLTQINGINTLTAQIITAEIGLDMSKWSTEKHFTSWLGLCPDTRRSGGKQLKGKGKKRKVVNRAAQALRMAAQSLKESKSALGAYLRRMKSRLGMAMAIKATAHKLARLVYRMLKYGEEYVDQGERYYEEKYRQRTIKNLKKRAETLGFELMEKQPTAQALQ